MNKNIIFSFIFVLVLISGCTLTETGQDNIEGSDDASTEILHSDLGNLDELEADLEELGDIDLDELDF